MIFVFTGNGKGKTTCAFGMALRAAGAGRKVCIVQFLKTGESSEIKALKNVSNIRVKSFGAGDFIFDKRINKKQKLLAQKALAFAKKQTSDMLILDEINVALYFNLLKLKWVIDFLKEKKEKTDIVLTGRKCPKRIMEIADLITEMKEIKHYYKKGVKAKRGVEY